MVNGLSLKVLMVYFDCLGNDNNSVFFFKIIFNYIVILDKL